MVAKANFGFRRRVGFPPAPPLPFLALLNRRMNPPVIDRQRDRKEAKIVSYRKRGGPSVSFIAPAFAF